MKLARIQIIRFVAAAAVVLYHASGTLNTYVPFSIPFPMKHGYAGVDLFFVISGFIIQLTTRGREHDWRQFLRRRIERVVPLYWLITLFSIVVLLVPGVDFGGPPSLAFALRSLTFTAWTEAPGQMPIVFPGWSLEYEMLFYITTTFALGLSAAPWLYVCIAFAGLVAIGASVGIDPAAVRLGFFVHPMLLEFCFGVLIGLSFERGSLPWGCIAVVAAALALLLIWPDGDSWRVWTAGLPSAALVAVAAKMDARNAVRNHIGRALARLGDATYSIYLVHVLVVSSACKLVATVAPPYLVVAVIFTTAIAVGYVVNRLVERHIQDFMNSKRNAPGQNRERTMSIR